MRFSPAAALLEVLQITWLQFCVFEDLAEVLALNQFHDEVGVDAFLAEVVYRDDVLVD